MNKTFLSCTLPVDDDKEDKDELSQSEDSDQQNEIEDLSDLFTKIEKMLGQDVKNARETRRHKRISRSQSVFEEFKGQSLLAPATPSPSLSSRSRRLSERLSR